MSCTELCKRMRKIPARYNNGQKSCRECERFWKTDRITCECCGGRLRSKSRNSKYRKFQEITT